MRTLFTIIFFIYLLTLLFAGTLSAQWVQTSLDSVNVICFAVSGTNLFAGTYNSGVFRSIDNGNTWDTTGLMNQDIGELAIMGANLFAVSLWPRDYDSGRLPLFRSTDNGMSWTLLYNFGGDNYPSLIAHNQKLYFSAHDCGGGDCDTQPAEGVLVSTDEGVTWTTKNNGLTNYSMGDLVSNNSTIFAGTKSNSSLQNTSQGIFRSIDDGDTWVMVNMGLPCYGCDMPSRWYPQVNSFAVSGQNIFVGTGWFGLYTIGGVFLSTNNGDSWSSFNTGLTDSSVRCFAVSGSSVFAGTAHGVFLTMNNGTNWTEVNTNLTDSNIVALTISDSFLFAGTNSGVWKRPLSEMIIDNIEPPSKEIPTQYSLSQNYPNPFNPSTTISYQLPTQSHVTLKIFDVLGREVATPVNNVEEPGYKSVKFDANGLSSGLYFYRLQAGKYFETKKLMLLR